MGRTRVLGSVQGKKNSGSGMVMVMNAGLESGKGGAGMAKNQRNEKLVSSN